MSFVLGAVCFMVSYFTCTGAFALTSTLTLTSLFNVNGSHLLLHLHVHPFCFNGNGVEHFCRSASTCASNQAMSTQIHRGLLAPGAGRRSTGGELRGTAAWRRKKEKQIVSKHETRQGNRPAPSEGEHLGRLHHPAVNETKYMLCITCKLI